MSIYQFRWAYHECPSLAALANRENVNHYFCELQWLHEFMAILHRRCCLLQVPLFRF